MRVRSSSAGMLEREVPRREVHPEQSVNRSMKDSTGGGNRTVLFIRHSKSETHAGKAGTCSKRVPLTFCGKDQAQDIANKLTRKPDLIISSPYVRAWQTALPTRRRFPRVPCKVWLDVQEFDYLGVIEGVFSSKEERSELVTEYWEKNDPGWNFECKESECESFAHFIQRTEATLARLQKQKGLIIIFTHEQFIRAVQGLLAGWLEPTPEKMRQFRQYLLDQPLPFGAIQVMKDRKMQSWDAYQEEEAAREREKARKKEAARKQLQVIPGGAERSERKDLRGQLWQPRPGYRELSGQLGAAY